MRHTVIMLIVLWISACATGPDRTTTEGLPDTGEPVLHAVQNARLQALMTEINSLMFDRMRTELDIDRERRRRTAQIEEVAGSLSKNIDSILETLPELDLSAAEQKTFASLANQLRDQARVLEDQAHRNHIDAIPQTLDRMKQTCTSCHRLFRNTGG